MEYLISLIIAALLALIPAKLAQRKGYSFGMWYLYGLLFFIGAMILVIIIKDNNSTNEEEISIAKVGVASNAIGVNDVILKYKELLDAEVITEGEYDILKRKIS